MSEENKQGRKRDGARRSARPQNIRVSTGINWEEITFYSEEAQAGPEGLEELSPPEEIPVREKPVPQQPQAELASPSDLTEENIETITKAVAEKSIQAEPVTPRSKKRAGYHPTRAGISAGQADPAAGSTDGEAGASSESGPGVKAEPAPSSSRPESGGKQAVSRPRSARPVQISYIDASRHEPVYEVPLNKRHRKRGLKIFGFVLGMLLIAAGTAYAGVSYYYTDHFLPGTTVNGIDCANKTAYEVEQLIAAGYDDYSIKVASRGNQAQEITGSSIGYHYLSSGEVLALLQKQKPYAWLPALFKKTAYTTTTNIAFDKNLLRTQLRALDCTQMENQESPENAYVTMEGDSFTIVPETEGNEIRVKEAFQMLDNAVAAGDAAVNFDSDPDVYKQPELTKDSPLIQSMLNAYNNYAAARITYTFGNETQVLDSDTLKTWLEFDEKGQLLTGDSSFEQHVRDYVADMAAKYDTVGTSRAFQTTSGRTVYVYGSAYGWQIDQEAEVAELMDEITSGVQITRDPVYSMTANARGYNDIGDTYVEVDMGNQHMYYYQDGADIFESDFVSGDITYGNRATPEGIYTLYFKQSPAVLRGGADANGNPEYETSVTYWMPFNGGIGFHDAEWQPYFGGDRFMGGGSHGCINLPYDSAAALYSIIDYGVPIVCFY